jgi:predicted RNA binding protein YcfA (HicA-like mRNA interferase family)
MPKLPAVKPRELIRFLEQHGFVLDHVTGSHQVFYDPETKRRAVVARHNREIPKGTLISLLRKPVLPRNNCASFCKDVEHLQEERAFDRETRIH